MTSPAPKYLNPLTDFGFKKLFGSEPNKDLLIDFLNQIITDHHIVDLTYAPNEHLAKTPFDRKAIFDIYCTGKSGERFIVEMQKAKQTYFKDRSIFYVSFPIQDQGKQKDWNYRLDPVYSIGILDFVLDKDRDEFFHVMELKNQRGEIFYDKLRFVYIELPKFRKKVSELATGLDKWCYFLKHLAGLDRVPSVLGGAIFGRAFAEAALARLSRGERVVYEDSLKHYRDLRNVTDTAREEGQEVGWRAGKEEGHREGKKQGKEEGLKEGIEKGMKKGREEGLAERTIEIAEKLKSQGMPDEVIAQATGLPISEIEKL